MIIFRLRVKLNEPMIVLIITCISSLLLTTDGLLSNPKSALLTPHRPRNQLSCQRLLPRIPSSPSTLRTTECKSKQDPSLDTVTGNDNDKENNDDIDGKAETKRSNNGNDRRNDLQDKNSPAPTPPEGLSTPAVLFATVLFVSFWPLLALLRSTSNPIDGFDIDMFMALKGIIDTTPMPDMDPTVMELPSLSPAEQLVGSIFGPPKR